jgi:hypothetical protein
VFIGFCLEALCERIVFVMADVLAGFPEIIEGGMQAARLIRDLIHPRVVVQVLSVVDRSLFDLIDGCGRGALGDETSRWFERLKGEGRIFGANSQFGNFITKMELYFKNGNN